MINEKYFMPRKEEKKSIKKNLFFSITPTTLATSN